MTTTPGPQRPRPTATMRVLRILPTAIIVLWVTGVFRFRDYGVGPTAMLTMAAAAMAMQVLLTRLRGPERPLVLPPNANPQTVALLAALLAGGIGLMLGGLFEATIPDEGGSVPWSLRTIWHGACIFAASYCRFLARLSTARDAGPPGPPADR